MGTEADLCGVNGCSFSSTHQGAHEYEAGEWSASEHAMYMPPWADHPPGCGAVEYGPRTASAYARKLVEYDHEHRGAIGSASLWDRELAAAHHVQMPAGQVERKDGELFERRFPVLAAELPRRELEAASMFWRDRVSVGRIAKAMGVATATVRTWISRTRERLLATARAEE